jgi:hypothetical protein
VEVSVGAPGFWKKKFITNEIAYGKQTISKVSAYLCGGERWCTRLLEEEVKRFTTPPKHG